MKCLDDDQVRSCLAERARLANAGDRQNAERRQCAVDLQRRLESVEAGLAAQLAYRIQTAHPEELIRVLRSLLLDPLSPANRSAVISAFVRTDREGERG